MKNSNLKSMMNYCLFVSIYLLNHPYVSYGQNCKPLWDNQCTIDSDCCSRKCSRGSSDWQYGVCYPNNEISEDCKPLWYNQCTKDSDCCSGKCSKGSPDWQYGVCKVNDGQPGGETGTGGGGAGIGGQGFVTVDEFQKCAASFGFGTPSENIANSFISQAQTKGGITSKLEAFIAIAQLSWESAGFTARSEWACSGGRWSAWPCASYSTDGCPAGLKYYGRGFIQLTHCYNYKAASADFPGIVENPDLVATDDTIAMGTALWFWRTNVHNAAGVQEGAFGSATRAINGGLECTPNGNTNLARERWNKFNTCLQSAGSTGLNPREEGCY